MKSFRAWTVVALCGVLSALTACSSNFVKPGYDFHSIGKVAVFVTVNAGLPPQQQAVADLFAARVVQKGYDVIDRAKLANLGNDAAFQSLSRIPSAEGRAKLASHNVSAVIVVDVQMPIGSHWRAQYGYTDEDEEVIYIKAKMMDVKTGTLLWSGEGNGVLTFDMVMSDSAFLGEDPGEAARSAIGKTPRVLIGGLAVAPAGTAVGAPLRPDMAELMQSAIEKTCRELPVRTQATVPGTSVSKPAAGG